MPHPPGPRERASSRSRAIRRGRARRAALLRKQGRGLLTTVATGSSTGTLKALFAPCRGQARPTRPARSGRGTRTVLLPRGQLGAVCCAPARTLAHPPAAAGAPPPHSRWANAAFTKAASATRRKRISTASNTSTSRRIQTTSQGVCRRGYPLITYLPRTTSHRSRRHHASHRDTVRRGSSAVARSRSCRTDTHERTGGLHHRLHLMGISCRWRGYKTLVH